MKLPAEAERKMPFSIAPKEAIAIGSLQLASSDIEMMSTLSCTSESAIVIHGNSEDGDLFSSSLACSAVSFDGVSFDCCLQFWRR